MPDHLIDLIRYDRWATDRMAGAMAAAPEIDNDALLLLSHIVAVQRVWLARAKGENPALDVWTLMDFDACMADGPDLSAQWERLIASHGAEAWHAAIGYRNSRGEAYTDTLGQLVTHVVNHGTAHRAQIARILREHGRQPPTVDYVFYLREKE